MESRCKISNDVRDSRKSTCPPKCLCCLCQKDESDNFRMDLITVHHHAEQDNNMASAEDAFLMNCIPLCPDCHAVGESFRLPSQHLSKVNRPLIQKRSLIKRQLNEVGDEVIILQA